MQTVFMSHLLKIFLLAASMALAMPGSAVAAAEGNADGGETTELDTDHSQVISDPDSATDGTQPAQAETQSANDDELIAKPALDTMSQLVIKLFEGGMVAPFKAYIGDSSNWRLPVAGTSITSWGESISVEIADHTAIGDAQRITWHGGTGQYFVQAEDFMDMRDLLDSEAALVMLLRIDEPPAGDFAIRMDCGFPCGASADLARPFRSIPPGAWFRLAIDLQCFAKEGADFARIDTPFLLLADKAFILSVSSVAFVRDAAKDATVKCQ